MLKRLFLLLSFILLSILVFKNQSILVQQPIAVDQPLNTLGQLQYFRHTSAMSLDQARTLADQDWQSIDLDQANFGFDQQHYWFRVPITGAYPSSSNWFLRCDYPLLDELDVYLFHNDRLTQEFHTGDTLPFSERPLRQPNFIFPLTIMKADNYWLYIHIYTTSSVQLPISLQPESTFWQTVANENIFDTAFYSILLCMLVYNAIILLLLRERSYFYYIAYLASFTLLMASIHGWSYPLLWPNSPNIHQLSVVVSLACSVWFGLLFVSHFLRLKKIRPEIGRFFNALIWISAVCALSSIFIPYGLAIKINTALALFASLAGCIIAIQEWLRNRSREIMMFIIAWATLLVGFLLFISQKFGLLAVTPFTEHAIEIGAILEVLLLALGLADRMNSERKKRIKAQNEMIVVQRQANAELDKKVRERTEELERLNDQLHEASITDSLTQVKNRRYFDKKIPIEYRRAFREKSWVSLLMIDIDHFKHINDQYGHQAGDKVLQVVADTLKSVVKRPSDAVSRYGGEEFVILLPHTPKEGALSVAERVRQTINELSIAWLDEQLSVTISIGVASCIPTDAKASHGFIQQADHYLYVAKENGRNQVAKEVLSSAVPSA